MVAMSGLVMFASQLSVKKCVLTLGKSQIALVKGIK